LYLLHATDLFARSEVVEDVVWCHALAVSLH